MPGYSTKRTCYLPPHAQIVAKKKRKSSKIWFTKKEPTMPMKIWMKIMWSKKKKRVKKLSWNWRKRNKNCPNLR